MSTALQHQMRAQERQESLMVDLCARLPANEGREPELTSHRTSAAVDAALPRGAFAAVDSMDLFDQERFSPNELRVHALPKPYQLPLHSSTRDGTFGEQTHGTVTEFYSIGEDMQPAPAVSQAQSPGTGLPACPLTCAPTSAGSAQPPHKAPPVGFDSYPPGNQRSPGKYKAAPAPKVSEHMADVTKAPPLKPPPPAPPRVDVLKPQPPTVDAPKPQPPVTDVPKPPPPMVDVPKYQPHMAAVPKPPPRTLDCPMAGGQSPMQPKKSAPKCPSIS